MGMKRYVGLSVAGGLFLAASLLFVNVPTASAYCSPPNYGSTGTSYDIQLRSYNDCIKREMRAQQQQLDELQRQQDSYVSPATYVPLATYAPPATYLPRVTATTAAPYVPVVPAASSSSSDNGFLGLGIGFGTFVVIVIVVLVLWAANSDSNKES